MNKEELLQELSTKISTSEISRDEVTNRLGFVAPTTHQVRNEVKNQEATKISHFSLTKVLYVLGATIVIVGIFIFVYQIWINIDSFIRIAITLGLGLLIAAIGSMLLKQKPEDSLGPIFHFIGGILIPVGAIVTLYEVGEPTGSFWPVAITFGIIFALYLTLSIIHKHPILTFFAIANGTAFFYLFVLAMVEKSYFNYYDLFAYITMAIGASYLFLAKAFRDGWNKKLLGALCFFGSGGILGAAFSQVNDSTPWQLFYFLILFGGLYLSVNMKSLIILVMSTLFLIYHVSFITFEYFADSVGWSISLIILGFVFIGFGYVSITINNKYIKGG